MKHKYIKIFKWIFTAIIILILLILFSFQNILIFACGKIINSQSTAVIDRYVNDDVVFKTPNGDYLYKDIRENIANAYNDEEIAFPIEFFYRGCEHISGGFWERLFKEHKIELNGYITHGNYVPVKNYRHDEFLIILEFDNAFCHKLLQVQYFDKDTLTDYFITGNHPTVEN